MDFVGNERHFKDQSATRTNVYRFHIPTICNRYNTQTIHLFLVSDGVINQSTSIKKIVDVFYQTHGDLKTRCQKVVEFARGQNGDDATCVIIQFKLGTDSDDAKDASRPRSSTVSTILDDELAKDEHPFHVENALIVSDQPVANNPQSRTRKKSFRPTIMRTRLQSRLWEQPVSSRTRSKRKLESEQELLKRYL